MAEATLYTDGSCLQGRDQATGADRRRGRGGYAAIVEVGHEGWVVRGHAHDTTNTAMEMRAVIEGLRSLGGYADAAVVHTDCAGLFQSVHQRWRRRELSAFVRSRRAAQRRHYDDWLELAALFELRLVVFRQVPAHPHAVYMAHQRAHKLARMEARQHHGDPPVPPSKRERQRARRLAVEQHQLRPHLRGHPSGRDVPVHHLHGCTRYSCAPGCPAQWVVRTAW